MKTTRIALMAGMGALLAAGIVFAAAASSGHAYRGRGERLAQALGLTDAQKAQIRPILEKYRPQFRALRSEKLAPEAKGARFADLRTKMQAEIAPILTQQQRDKVAQMRQARANGRCGRHSGFRRHAGRRIAQALQLTPDQQQKIQGIVAAHRSDIRSIVAQVRAGKLDRTQAHARIKSIREETKTQVESVLTPEQQQKLQALREQHLNRER